MTTHDFLALLGERHTFQTFDDSGKDRSLSRVLHGTYSEHAKALSALNARGAGVFVMVNEGDGSGRAAGNVTRVRALFIDLDGAPLDPVQSAPLVPHCIVESSPGRWHAYWLTDDCPMTLFKSLQKALADRFNGDAKICDLPRVMRLPGFQHRKRAPFTSRIEALSRTLAPYGLTEFVDAFALSSALENAERPPTNAPRRLPSTIPEGTRNTTLISLAGRLVRKGYDAPAIVGRLQRINAERCQPPLAAAEIDAIATRAAAYGSEGFVLLPHRLLDSTEWKALPPAAHDLICTAFRRFDGSNNGSIALTWTDFAGLPGFRNAGVFYRHRSATVSSGILIETRKGAHTQQGVTPSLFAIADRFLHVPLAANSAGCPSSTIRQSYIDKQAGVGDMAEGERLSVQTVEAKA